MISKNTVIVASTDQISSDLGGESVILDTKSGIYYGLNEVGASIWNLIQEAKTVEQIHNFILEEYEVDYSECEGDILALIQELLAIGLIKVKDEAIA